MAVTVGVWVGVGVNVGVSVSVGVEVGVRVGGRHCVGVGFKVFGGLLVPGPTRYGVCVGPAGDTLASGSGITVGVGGRIARATNPKQ